MSDTNDTGAAQPAADAVEQPLATTVDQAPASVTVSADDHAEAQGIFASLVAKLENFEHALAADAKADLEKIKALFHL